MRRRPIFLNCIDAGEPLLEMNALGTESIFVATTMLFYNVIRDIAAKYPEWRVVQGVASEKLSARLVADVMSISWK